MSVSFASPFALRRSAAPLHPLAAVGFSLSAVVIWALWAAYFNTAQFGDNVEQFNWAQSLELGYHKHPPLPSWALGGVIQLFGPSVYWAYGLATLCLLGTASFTWLIGRRLVGDRVAAAAIVMWGLSLSFSQRAQLYNHNTVLVLCIAMTVWFAMRASAASRFATPWWIATGVAGAAAVLSKYQAVVPLGGIIVALAGAGGLVRPEQRRGLGLAIVVLLLACSPHVIWVARHDYSTLRYASEAIATSTLAERAGFIVSFFANQLRINLPIPLAICLCWAFGRLAPTPGAPSDARVAASMSVWMFGLVGVGLLVLVVMALGGGVSLRNHWGVQALQFLCLWIACRWERRQPIDLRRLVVAASVVHAVGLAGYAVEHEDPSGVLSNRRIDTMYPARRLARAAVAHWTETTSCPMHYVAGSVFDSGLVSLYSGSDLKVFDTASATPWVQPDDLVRRGALYVIDGDDPVPPGVTEVIPFDLVPGDHSGRPTKTIRIGLQLPQGVCSD